VKRPRRIPWVMTPVRDAFIEHHGLYRRTYGSLDRRCVRSVMGACGSAYLDCTSSASASSVLDPRGFGAPLTNMVINSSTYDAAERTER
jgi:hypothetical protein